MDRSFILVNVKVSPSVTLKHKATLSSGMEALLDDNSLKGTNASLTSTRITSALSHRGSSRLTLTSTRIQLGTSMCYLLLPYV